MSTNITSIQMNDIVTVYISFTVSFLSVIISSFICLMITIIITITASLHSPTNLLLCNTCLCTLLYSIISTINTFIFNLEPISTDWSCRIRGYLGYVSLNLVIYSYVIQAISRLFWTILYKYRYLLTIKCHIYLILIQICLSFIIPLSSIVTKDIIYRPLKMCFVSMKYKLHVFYLLIIGYIIPLLIVIILYIIIYRYIIRSTSRFRRGSIRTKRDSELARNILILLCIFMFGGIPTVIYMITSNVTDSVPRLLFFFAVTAPSIAVAIEKIVTVIVNKDIRKAFKQRWMTCCPNYLTSSTRVKPFTGKTMTTHTISETIHVTVMKKTQGNI